MENRYIIERERYKNNRFLDICRIYEISVDGLPIRLIGKVIASIIMTDKDILNEVLNK